MCRYIISRSTAAYNSVLGSLRIDLPVVRERPGCERVITVPETGIVIYYAKPMRNYISVLGNPKRGIITTMLKKGLFIDI